MRIPNAITDQTHLLQASLTSCGSVFRQSIGTTLGSRGPRCRASTPSRDGTTTTHQPDLSCKGGQEGQCEHRKLNGIDCHGTLAYRECNPRLRFCFFYKLYFDSRGIRTRIVRVKGKDADQLTTTTAQASKLLCPLEVMSYDY